MTSAVVPTTFTSVWAGMWISSAVTAAVPGYRTSHHHWWPVTSTVSFVDRGSGASVLPST